METDEKESCSEEFHCVHAAITAHMARLVRFSPAMHIYSLVLSADTYQYHHHGIVFICHLTMGLQWHITCHLY